MRYPLTIFYDASCPMCANEMHALKALDGGGRLELVDCSAPDFDEGVLGREDLTRAALMARIHARDADGRWLAAIDVYEATYRAVGLETPARIWGHRLLKPLWSALYPIVADNRQLLSRLGASRLMQWLIPKRACGVRELR